MKLCAFGYIAPPTVGHSEAFLRNLTKYKCRTDLLLFSEHPWPGVLKLKGSPEILKDALFPGTKDRNKFGIPNATWLTGCKIALERGYSHAIVLEPDCRVGRDDWDQFIWQEYFALAFPAIAAGTLVCYNPCNHSPEAGRRWQDLMHHNSKRNFPIVTYGYRGAGQPGGTCVFPNGALAVYDLHWMAKLFSLAVCMDTAVKINAWDMEVGFKLWEVFQEHSYDMVGMIDCIFSGYGDLVTTEDERRDMLLRGDVVAIHQVKSDWTP